MSTRLSLAALLACTALVHGGAALAAQATSTLKTNLVNVPEVSKSNARTEPVSEAGAATTWANPVTVSTTRSRSLSVMP